MKHINTIKNIYTITAGISLLALVIFNFSGSALASEYGENQYESYAQDAKQMREEGVKIFRTAAEKTGDNKFNRLADALEHASLLPGNDSDCASDEGDRTLAYTDPGRDANYFCVSPTMHTLLHETVHTIQGFWQSSHDDECEADNYMIKALYYGAGQLEQGNYDDECPANVDLERSLGGGR